MAGESSERIGGISVAIGGSDAELEAVLDRAAQRISAWTQKYGNPRVNIGGADTGRSGRGGPQAVSLDTKALEGKIDQLVAALGRGGVRAAASRSVDAEQVTINGVKVGRLSNLGASLQQAIGPVEVDADVEAADEKVQNLRVNAAKPVEVNLDISAALGKIDELTAAIAGLTEKMASLPTPAAGGGGGRRRRGSRQGTAEPSEGGEGNQGGRVQILRQPNISQYENPGPFGNRGGRIKYIRDIGSAPAINIQPNMRVVRSPQQRALEEREREARRENDRIAREERRRPIPLPLDYDPATAGAPASATFAPQRDPNAPLPDEGRRVVAAPRGNNAPPPPPPQPTPPPAAPSLGRETDLRFARALDRRLLQQAQIERAIEQQRIRQESVNLTAGRTPRTAASSLAGFLIGPRQEEEEARRGLGSAEAELRSAQKYRMVFEDEMTKRIVAQEYAANDTERAQLRRSVAAIRASEQYREALDEEEKATLKVRDASEEVAKFSRGFAPAARTLLAVTAGGAAFGAGLASIKVGMEVLERASRPYFDRLTGYATKTVELTGALADQARQQNGNVEAVTSLKMAQAGFSADAARSIQPLIQQRVQIEAGNKALVEQIETYRIAENLRRQSPNAGIGGGGTGGVLGTSLFGIPSTGEQTGNFLQSLDDLSRLTVNAEAPEFARRMMYGANVQRVMSPEEQESLVSESVNRGLDFINSQLAKGGKGDVQFERAMSPDDPRIAATAQAFATLSPEMAKAITELGLFSTAIAGAEDAVGEAIGALRGLNAAGLIPDQEILLAQFERQRFAFMRQLDRQQDFQIGTQIPAQTALSKLAAPALPVGTGIVAANADEQARITAETAKTQRLQDSLNTYYKQGQRILMDTYKIPQTLLSNITSVGKEIASTQAGIANAQATYQVAQFNYQLMISRRTLSDISGLTGRSDLFGGASSLGVLERQNLLLGRQAQTLQFMLSQRQINFQRAVAGFTVPGLTPAEQNARIAEAKIEADFAQKQLDIQKQMFGNQVQIVDISNLRQGMDLAAQIGLMLQGRQVTIDTALAQEKLARLQSQQAILVEEAGTYLTKTNAAVAQAMSEMQQLEATTGQAIARTTEQGIIAAYRVGHAFYMGITGGFLSNSTAPKPSLAGGGSGGGTTTRLNAEGFLGTVNGPTNMVMGEAGSETVAILRNPRNVMGGTSGGGDSIVNFYGDITVRTEADIEEIARKVTAAQGRRAALAGLRSPN